MTDNPTGQAVPDEGAASPRLQDVIRSAVEEVNQIGCENDLTDTDLDDVTARAFDAWREVCMVRTVEQLDALPEGSVIRSGRSVLERGSSRGRGLGPVESRWYGIGWELSVDADDTELPALLVWHPDWDDDPTPPMCPRGHGPLENGDCPDCGFAL